MAYRVTGWDAHGAVMEILQVALIVGGIVVVVLVLIIIDPNDLAASHQFNWPWLLVLAGLVMNYVTVWKHVWIQFKLDTKYTAEIQQRMIQWDIGSLAEVCASNSALRDDFRKFATQQYAIENVNFIQDVDMYMRYYSEKAWNWRRSKFYALCDMYIEVGAPQEINISHDMRVELLDVRDQLKTHEANGNPEEDYQFVVRSGKRLDELFGPAQAEILNIVQQCSWREFVLSKQDNDLAHTVSRSSVASRGGSVASRGTSNVSSASFKMELEQT